MIATIFDTETTALIQNGTIALEQQPFVIEFYGNTVDLATGEVIGDLHKVIKPPHPISEEISKITGLTNSDLEGQPKFAIVAGAIRAFLENSPIVIAHNLSFDIEIINFEFTRNGGRLVNWPRQICTVEQTVHLLGKRLTLTNMHQHLFERPFPDAHRARPDVEALTRCCVELYKRGHL